jgi:uncharacterized membrane-anchored protein YhcB (DUF1043 family)
MNKITPFLSLLLVGIIIGYIIANFTIKPEVQIKEVIKKEFVVQHSECGSFSKK